MPDKKKDEAITQIDVAKAVKAVKQEMADLLKSHEAALTAKDVEVQKAKGEAEAELVKAAQRTALNYVDLGDATSEEIAKAMVEINKSDSGRMITAMLEKAVARNINMVEFEELGASTEEVQETGLMKALKLQNK